MSENCGIKFLIAEDEDSNYSYLERVIRKKYGVGCMVRAKTGLEAIEILKANHGIAIILLDIKMPVMSGLEAVKHLKELNDRVPIIAITAYAMAGDKEMVFESGFDDYVAKPFEPNVIIEVITLNLEKYGIVL